LANKNSLFGPVLTSAASISEVATSTDEWSLFMVNLSIYSRKCQCWSTRSLASGF